MPKGRTKKGKETDFQQLSDSSSIQIGKALKISFENSKLILGDTKMKLKHWTYEDILVRVLAKKELQTRKENMEKSKRTGKCLTAVEKALERKAFEIKMFHAGY